MEANESELRAKVASIFNEKYGKELLDLKRCEEIKLEYQNKLERLEREVGFP